jgi:hypothetical protein
VAGVHMGSASAMTPRTTGVRRSPVAATVHGLEAGAAIGRSRAREPHPEREGRAGRDRGDDASYRAHFRTPFHEVGRQTAEPSCTRVPEPKLNAATSPASGLARRAGAPAAVVPARMRVGPMRRASRSVGTGPCSTMRLPFQTEGVRVTA